MVKRFWDKVDKSGDCWLWTASTNKPNGYGQLWFWSRPNRIKKLAHRLSYEMHYGPIPNGMNVLHKCDTPSCVNPKHLFLGTQSDNLTDALKKTRISAAKLCELDVEIIRSLPNTSRKKLAEFFGVSISAIRDIRNYRCWKHVKPIF